MRLLPDKFPGDRGNRMAIADGYFVDTSIKI